MEGCGDDEAVDIAARLPVAKLGSVKVRRAADADLRRLIHAWPDLPAVVRAGIMAMVEASS